MLPYLGVRSIGEVAVLQASMFDGHAFDAGALASEGVGKPGFGFVRPCRCCPERGGSVCLNGPARLLSRAAAGFMPLREAVG